jgi:hypothetical protein
VKTTVELPDELLRRAKSTAATRGESLRDLLTRALAAHLDRADEARAEGQEAWRPLFGAARVEEVADVDAEVASALERVDLETWK